MADISYIVGTGEDLKKVTIKRAEGSDGNSILELPQNGSELATVSDLSGVVFTKAIFVEKPSIISPLNSSTGFKGNVTISAYQASANYIGDCAFTEVELATDALFTDIIRTVKVAGEVNNVFIEPTTSLSTVFVRARYLTGVHSSEWSNIVSAVVGQLEYIAKPSILNPINDATNQLLTTFIQGSDFVCMGATDSTHASTEYQIATDIDFTTIYFEEVSTTDLTTNVIDTLLANATTYYIRIRYTGTKYGTSDWSDVIKITTYAVNIDFGVDGNNTILAGNTLDGAYFGQINYSTTVERNYRGHYRTGTTFKANTQVSHNNKTWNAKVDVSNITPGTDATKWEEDTRENLPTAKWLLDVVGIGYGQADNNNDGYSADGVAIGGLVNSTDNWLKFAYNNKIFYTPKRPVVTSIGWNDIAKRYAVYGNDRTVRIGTRLYYIRLLKEEEYLNCIAALTDGRLGNLTTTELALTNKTWVEDLRESTVRKTISGTNTVLDVNPKSRTCAYRPVLELIEEGDEPYNNLPVGLPVATSENFQYDKYTDTGYFGIVPTTSLATGSALATAIGLSAGVAQNDTEGYLKFYWHGKVLFIGKKSYRHTITWDNIKAANAVYGIDLGGSGKKVFTKNGINYKVALMTGSGKAPSNDVQYWTNYFDDASPTSTEDFPANVAMEIGRYSMWNELMYRVHTTFVDDVLANQDGDANYKELTGGVQIGANWANMTNIDLNIYYAVGGNGTATWCQETSSYDSSVRVFRGHSRLAYSNGGTSSASNVHLGWRAMLIA